PAELYPLSLHDALPIFAAWALRSKPAALRHSIWSIAIASQLVLPIAALLMPQRAVQLGPLSDAYSRVAAVTVIPGAATNQQSPRSEEHTSELQSLAYLV